MTVTVTSDGRLPSASVAMPRKLDAGDTFAKVVDGANLYYGSLAQINSAKYGTKLLKAQAQGEVAAARSGGRAAAYDAGQGLPSPSLLIVGALGLAALLVLRR